MEKSFNTCKDDVRRLYNMVINYKEYYSKVKKKRNKYKKNRKLEAMLDKLYEWQIQDARVQASNGEKVIFID